MQLEKNLSGSKIIIAFIWPENDFAFRASEIQNTSTWSPEQRYQSFQFAASIYAKMRQMIKFLIRRISV